MEEVVAVATWLTEGFVDAATAEAAYAMFSYDGCVLRIGLPVID
ncbi:hypothetical protein A2U01_0117910, partial [Trifolium medium]|nr:hypothetical protein [Trifolium medium]